MADISKVTTDRLKVSGTLIAAFDGQGGTISTALEASPNAPPAGLAVSIMTWLRGAVEASGDNLREADLAHAMEGDDDEEPRRRRVASERELRDALLSGADAVRGVYGRPFSKLVGLDTALAARADQLQHQADGVARALTTNPAPAPLHEGASVNLAVIAANIESKRAALQAALDKVALEERELQSTMSLRDQATARWTRTYSGVAMILSGMATLAGLDDLAAKVKPTERKRAGIPEDEV
jgi:hypothetical protein